MLLRAALPQAIATLGMSDIAALDVTPTKTSGDGDMRVGASSSKAEVATVNEVAGANGEAEMGVG
jgi:hypothetical protein